MRSAELPLDQLLLDPNNYRLQEQDGFVICANERFHLERVQSGTLQRLKKESLKPLRDSIVSNGFLEIERIVVVPYEHEDDKYVVIEGNRRIAALIQIRDEFDGGVDIPDNVVEKFEAVPCLIADDDGQVAFFREAIMGIRHVGGIREWGGFQRAKLIADLHDDHDLDSGAISERLGLSVMEVNRRYRAFKALQQMIEDDEYSEHATAALYPLFHEAVSLPSVREWLGWNADTNTFDDAETRETFYQLLSPREADQGDPREPKIKTYLDVRQLRTILPNQDAKADLIQLDRDLVDALTIANRNEMTRRWRNEVSEAQTALTNIPALEVAGFAPEDVQSIQRLVETANQILQMHEQTR